MLWTYLPLYPQLRRIITINNSNNENWTGKHLGHAPPHPWWVCFKCQTLCRFSLSVQPPQLVGTIIMPILQMRKLRCKT